MSDDDAKFDYRARSRRRVDRAREHLSSGQKDHLIYACLELRLAIESLTYDLLRLYRDDVEPSTLQRWEPHKLFKELLAMDPDADAGMTLHVAGPDGTFDGPGSIEFKEHRLSGAWAQKMHRALGYFLHERLLRELESGKDSDFSKMQRKVEEAIKELDQIHESTGFNLRFRQAPKFSCVCGEQVSRFIARTQREVPVSCTACGKQYLIQRTASDEFRVLEKLEGRQDYSTFPTTHWIGGSEIPGNLPVKSSSEG